MRGTSGSISKFLPIHMFTGLAKNHTPAQLNMVAIITSYYRAIAIQFKAQNLRKFSFLLVIDKCLHYFKAWRLHRHRHHHLQLQLQYKFQQQQQQKSVHITINFCAVFYSCIYFHWNMCFLWLLLLLYLGCFNCFMLQIRNEDSTFSLPGCIRMEGEMLEHNRRRNGGCAGNRA